MKEYTATLKVDGQTEAKVIGWDKDFVASEIIHYFDEHFENGENFQITIKCKEITVN